MTRGTPAIKKCCSRMPFLRKVREVFHCWDYGRREIPVICFFRLFSLFPFPSFPFRQLLYIKRTERKWRKSYIICYIKYNTTKILYTYITIIYPPIQSVSSVPSACTRFVRLPFPPYTRGRNGKSEKNGNGRNRTPLYILYFLILN